MKRRPCFRPKSVDAEPVDDQAIHHDHDHRPDGVRSYRHEVHDGVDACDQDPEESAVEAAGECRRNDCLDRREPDGEPAPDGDGPVEQALRSRRPVEAAT